MLICVDAAAAAALGRRRSSAQQSDGVYGRARTVAASTDARAAKRRRVSCTADAPSSHERTAARCTDKASGPGVAQPGGQSARPIRASGGCECAAALSSEQQTSCLLKARTASESTKRRWVCGCCIWQRRQRVVQRRRPRARNLCSCFGGTGSNSKAPERRGERLTKRLSANAARERSRCSTRAVPAPKLLPGDCTAQARVARRGAGAQSQRSKGRVARRAPRRRRAHAAAHATWAVGNRQWSAQELNACADISFGDLRSSEDVEQSKGAGATAAHAGTAQHSSTRSTHVVGYS